MKDDRKYFIGVDLGGTNISTGLITEDGNIEFRLKRPTEAHRGTEAVIDRIIEMIVETIEKGNQTQKTISGVGVGAPGPIDRFSWVITESPNLGWKNVALRDIIAERTGLTAVLENDANAAAYGEFWLGDGRDVDSLVCVTIGTGIGGGIIYEDQVYHGATGVAGEIGHMSIDPGGRRCKCGNYGCLEAYASGPAIALRAREGIEVGEQSVISELVDDDLSKITSETVYQAVLREDLYAEEVMKDTAKYLGVGIANLLNILNPDMVVIYGGVTQAGRYLFDPLRNEVLKRAFRLASGKVRIVPAELGDKAGMIGAVGIAKGVLELQT